MELVVDVKTTLKGEEGDDLGMLDQELVQSHLELKGQVVEAYHEDTHLGTEYVLREESQGIKFSLLAITASYFP